MSCMDGPFPAREFGAVLASSLERSCIRPFCAVEDDRWPARVSRIGFQSSRRARGAMTRRSVPTQVLTILPSSLLLLTSRRALPVSRLVRLGPVVLALGEHGPDDAGGLGGLGDDGDLDRSAGEQAPDPGRAGARLGADVAQGAAGAQDQQPSQGPVAGFADVTGEPGLAAGVVVEAGQGPPGGG